MTTDSRMSINVTQILYNAREKLSLRRNSRLPQIYTILYDDDVNSFITNIIVF